MAKISIKNGLPNLSDVVAAYGFADLQGLKILFVNMPLREAAKPNVPPQGPALMAARLRQYGASPRIIDFNAYRLPKNNLGEVGHRLLSFDEAENLFLKYLQAYGDQDIIAISGMITTLKWQEWFAKVSKKYQPNAFLLSGGGLATQLKEGLFRWIDELDAIAHSEGDDIILVIGKQITQLKNQGRSINNNSNPYYLGELFGKDRYMYAGDRPVGLDELPFPAWDLIEHDVNGHEVLEAYIRASVWGGDANNSSAAPFTMKRSLTTVSSRGCPYACTFCYRGAQGERIYGMRSAENLAKEVAWLKNTYDLDFIGFPDDNFAVDKRRIRELPAAFEDLDIRWGTHTRLDEADQRLEDMAKSGCIYIGFGAESASENVLNNMKKGGFILKNGMVTINGYSFPKTMVDGIKNTLSNGIHSNCTWIMGFPGESLDDLKTSVAFIEWQKELVTAGLVEGTLEYKTAYDSINQNMFIATAYPGTEMFKHAKVRMLLNESFGINFDGQANPILDENFRSYVLELDDATKLLRNKDNKILNFGDIPDEQFVEAVDAVTTKNISHILDM